MKDINKMSFKEVVDKVKELDVDDEICIDEEFYDMASVDITSVASLDLMAQEMKALAVKYKDWEVSEGDRDIVLDMVLVKPIGVVAARKKFKKLIDDGSLVYEEAKERKELKRLLKKYGKEGL